jgi:hypothetical protein
MAVYPNEAWPADSSVLAIDGAMDLATGLPFIPKGTGPTSSPSYEVQYNRRQMRQNRILAGWRQGMVVDEGGLRIGVYPILFTMGGVRRSFDGVTGVSVPDNASRVVYLDTSATLQVVAAWPAEIADYLPLAAITTAGGVMTIEDRRGYVVFETPPAPRRCVSVGALQVGSNQNAVKVFEHDPSGDVVLEEVQVFCTATAGTVSLSVLTSQNAVLCGPFAPVAGTLIKPAITQAALSQPDTIGVHVTTDASGSIADLSVSLLLRHP